MVGLAQVLGPVPALGPVPVLGHLLVLFPTQVLCSAQVLCLVQVFCLAPLHLPSLDQRQVLESVPLLAWEENVKYGRSRQPKALPPHWNLKMMMSYAVSLKK